MNDPIDNFDLELSEDDGSIVLDSPIAEGLGVSDLDDLVLDMTDVEEELTLSDDEEELSDSILFKAGVDVSKTLTPYAQLVAEALTLAVDKEPTLGTDAFAVNSSEFDYMPEDVFRVFNGLLIDMAIGEEWQAKSVNECAELSLEELYDVTHWAPQLNKPEYISCFVRWCNKFRKLSTTLKTAKKGGILELINIPELQDAAGFFTVNTKAFNILSDFLGDGTVVTEGDIDPRSLGVLCQEYMERSNGKRFTVRDAYDCILGYLGSDELRSTLKLSQDELLEYSSGELIRRLLVFELTQSVVYPYGLKGKQSTDADAVLRFLSESNGSGSVACELLLMVMHIMLRYENYRHPGKTPQTYELCSALLMFFQAAIRDDAIINPMFYGYVKKAEGDNGFELAYAVADETLVVKSKDILCDVVGNKARTYCIPKIFKDSKHGYTVCPPSQLVTPMRSIAVSGRIPVTGEVSFKFTPTVSWLEANKILAQDSVTEDAPKSRGIAFVDNPLMETLLSYRNTFDDTGEEVLPVVVATKGYVLYSVGRSKADEVLDIFLAEKSDSNDIVSRKGTMVMDKDTENLIVSLDTSNGQSEEFVSSKTEYAEEFLGVATDVSATEQDISDIVFPAVQAKPVEYQEYRKAVRSLCELSALDYKEELDAVQEAIARDLFSIVYVPAIDELVSSRILKAYDTYITGNINEGKEHPLDDFNLPSFSELADIIEGSKNPFAEYKTWDEGFAKKYDVWKPNLLDVDAYCAMLDRLDFNVLALQILSRSEVRRTTDVRMYRALHGIPEIGSRLSRLEDKMVALRVLDLLGDQVQSVFSKRSYIGSAYSSQIVKDNINSVHTVLVEKSKRKDMDFTLSLSKKVLDCGGGADDVVLKYFILERNLYGLLDMLYTSPKEYEGKYTAFLEELGIPETTDFKAMSAAEFSELVPEKRVAEFFSGNNWEYMMELVERGLLREASGNNSFQVIKAFDLFNSFYDILVNTTRDVEEEDYSKDLYSYAGSLVVSYCPVVDISAGNIDGGSARTMEFVSSPDDFRYDAPIGYLAKYDIQDVRLAVEGQ